MFRLDIVVLVVSILCITRSMAADFRRWKKLGLEAQNSIFEHRRDMEKDGHSSCHALKQTFEASGGTDNSWVGGRESDMTCSCEALTNENNGEYSLACQDNTHYCSEDGTVLRTTASFEARLSRDGAMTAYREILSNKKDQNKLFTLDYLDCDGIENCNECQVSLDGLKCDSCVLNDCGDGHHLPSFSCENWEKGSNYDLCEESLSIPQGSFFEVVSGYEENVQPCNIHRELQITPTAAPTFINDTRCPLRIGTSNCPALIQATNLQPVDGCDCYNFCNGQYVGCTGLRETGSVECDTDFVPVAGCRLDGVVDEGDEVGCTATLPNNTEVFFPEGASFGNLVQVSQCQPTSEFPCFCRSLTESDQIRCPYCLFVQMGGTFVCARDNQNVTFVDTFGVTQNCNCNYIGNNQVITQCRPVIEPPQVCVNRRNTNQCAALTEFVNPIEDCDCYNFCEGQYSGCCRYGEACTASCPTGSSVNDIVAGCEIDPNKPPVVAPSNAPSSAPSPEPLTCLLEQNVQNCDVLTLNQDPIEGCDCYNYCGTRYGGCCVAGDPNCRASCTNLPVGASITAGCKLSSCTRNFGMCDSDADCCSGRCLFSLCRAPALTASKTSFKLSGTRGGAAARAKNNRRQLLTKEKKIKIRGL